LWRTLGSNRCCWIGAALGVVSMTAFNWIHVVRTPLPQWVLEQPAPFACWLWRYDPFHGFVDLLGDPGTILFLVGTALAFVTFLGGIAQSMGMAWFLFDKLWLNGYTPSIWHFELGVGLALVSTFIVLLGLATQLDRFSFGPGGNRIATMSARLQIYAR